MSRDKPVGRPIWILAWMAFIAILALNWLVERLVGRPL